MWNGCLDHDPSAQILTVWIAKEELRALFATAAGAGTPARSATGSTRSTAGAPMPTSPS